MLRSLAALPLLLAGAAQAQAVFFFEQNTAYLSTADIPAGFYDGGAPALLDNLEDGSLDTSLQGSGGSVIIDSFTGRRDSVDADDGAIDGTCGPQTAGRCGSWFNSAGGTGARFSFVGAGPLPTAFGLVWTDGGGTITFSATGFGGQSLGSFTASGFADGGTSGTTAEDRFFGVQFAGGIESVHIMNNGAGIEVDHIQYGQMAAAVPEPGSWALLLAGLGATALRLRQRAR